MKRWMPLLTVLLLVSVGQAATKTTQKTGVWSDTTVWDGGTLPADGDTIVVAANHTLTLDVDLTSAPYSWTAGAAGVTITSHATTPARLTCPTSAGTYVLPIKTGTTIAGTNAAALGQLYAGSSGTSLPSAATFRIVLLGTAQVDHTYLDVRLYCTQPTHPYVQLSAAEAAGQTVLSVGTDLTGDANGWAAGDAIGVVDVNGLDYERRTIAAAGVAAGEITVTAALTNAKITGAYLVKLNRNVEITFDGTQVAVTSTAISTFAAQKVWNCAIRQLNATAQGTCIRLRDGETCAAVVSHFDTGAAAMAYGVTFSGLAVGSVAGGVGVSCSRGTNVSGMVLGCTNGVYSGQGVTLTGNVLGCATGASAVVGFIHAGAIDGCSRAISTSTGEFHGGTCGRSFVNTTSDILFQCGAWKGHGGLFSATPVESYLGTSQVLTNPAAAYSSVTLYDPKDSAGSPQLGRLFRRGTGGKVDSQLHGQPDQWAATRVATALTTPTYDASGQAVHPDIIDAGAAGFGGKRYWMVMTPYTNGDGSVEKPSILCSDDLATWAVPDGLTNPIDGTAPAVFTNDPCLLLSNGTLYCFYGYTVGAEVLLHRKSSADGVTWSNRAAVSDYAVTSSSIIADGSGYTLWYVNSIAGQNTFIKRSMTGPTATPGDPTTCTIVNAPAGLELWHVCIRKHSSGYYAGLFTYATLDGSGANARNHWARSTDGLTWTVSSDPCCPIQAAGQWDENPYRGSMIETATGWTLIYSGRTGTAWRIGTTALADSVPPAALTFVHKSTFEDAGFSNFIDVPLWADKEVPVAVRVYARKLQNSMTATPWVKIIDPNKPWGDAAEALVSSTMADNLLWQTLVLTYTPTASRPVILRVGGTNATGTLYWNFDARRRYRPVQD